MKKLLSLLLAFLLLIPDVAIGGSLSITAWSTGDQLNSTNLNSRMTSITTWANGNISDTNISGTAAIAGSKLDLTSSTGRISHSTSVTSDAPVFTSGQTWDNVANVFSLWRGTVTNTNSASTSRLIDLRVGSTIIASISRVGQLMLTPQAYASGPSTLLEGAWFNIASATYTDNMTAASGTAPRFVAYAFQRPALAAGNSSVTTTHAATVFIASAPVTSTNMTITNRYALWVDQGDVRLGGNLFASGSTTVDGNLVVKGSLILGAISGTTITGTGLITGAGFTGTGNVAITPAAVSGTPAQHGLFQENVVKGWIYVTFSGGTPSIADSFNVTSITDVAQGQVDVTWDRDFANSTYAVSGITDGNAGAVWSAGGGTQTVTLVRLRITDLAAADQDYNFYAIAIGKQ